MQDVLDFKNKIMFISKSSQQLCLPTATEAVLMNEIIDVIIDRLASCSLSTVEKEILLGLLNKVNDDSLYRNHIPKGLPVIIRYVTDTSPRVRVVARDVMGKIVSSSGNEDLVPFVPVLMESMTTVSHTAQAIEQLAGCVFVQTVDAATLAVMAPVLQRGLRHKAYEVQRKSCVIIDNICKLIEDPSEIRGFMPDIYHLVHQCTQHISHPEARRMAERALETMNEIYDPTALAPPKTTREIEEVLREHGHANEYMTLLTNILCKYHYAFDVWLDVYDRCGGVPRQTCQKIFDACRAVVSEDPIFEDGDEDGEDLYTGEFSLAYGTLTLLRNARLHLKKNRCYGLLGPNNCGKTTLMRAIQNGQIDGFHVRALLVEHEIPEREIGEDEHHYPIYNTDLCGVDWILDYVNHVCQVKPPVSKAAVVEMMQEAGFGRSRAADMDMQITTYSGGWKMKMQLCAAKLLDTDILLLDEPTGHLDAANVEWLKQWLTEFLRGGGSIITTSHDSPFLAEMCTHIIEFQKKKLVTFKGTLHDFVQQHPDKQQYFELKNDAVRFEFPVPGPLAGVKSLSRAVLKMSNVTYTYPLRTTPTVTNISLECSRISRVAVVGPNGAGKSTAIKLLIGELEPSSGTIQKHPHLRVAYVAQHAFHHLENHGNRTPVQYIMWRFAGNEDKESVELVNKHQTEKKTPEKFVLDQGRLRECVSRDDETMAVEPEYILSRLENKKQRGVDYEVKWKNKSSDTNTWVARDILIRMGAVQMVQKFDEKEAAAQGLMHKPLTAKAIQEHCMRFGIDQESASHTLIKSLSGGQKIKVVLAASLWQRPHLMILDEPTNYLDRDSLGALVDAIRNFQGGVIIISHNREFADAIAQEKWIMESGSLRKEGESVSNHEDAAIAAGGDDVMTDAFGNEITIKNKKPLTPKERKQAIRHLRKLIHEGKKKGISDDLLLEYELRLEEHEHETV